MFHRGLFTHKEGWGLGRPALQLHQGWGSSRLLRGGKISFHIQQKVSSRVFSAATKLKGVLYWAGGASHQLHVALPLASYQRLSIEQLGR